ncbi:MAG: MgtC/SapB family protein [Cytophagaceae bacterium]|nr:MgtC/SapB family protein [Cytophagaceae bacterium]
MDTQLIKDFIYTEEGKLIVALIVGGIIGAEREYRSKAAGFRTVILVTLGSCLFTILSIKLGSIDDKSRIAANIVTGIGFLGAGAIYRDKISIRGITTATTIWISAAIGMAIGCGQFSLTIWVTCIAMTILLSFSWFQRIIDTVNQEKMYKITYDDQPDHIAAVEHLFHLHHLTCFRVKQIKHKDEIVIVYTANGKEKQHGLFLNELYRQNNIRSFEV